MKLAPKTKYAHQFLELYGNEWVLIRKSDSWYSAKRPGPWGYIQQVDGLKNIFIHLVDDHHFLIQR